MFILLIFNNLHSTLKKLAKSFLNKITFIEDNFTLSDPPSKHKFAV